MPNAGHWYDGILSEQDVQDSIQAVVSAEMNPGWPTPSSPKRFTLTSANPSESGSKFGWKIGEIEIPGRLARVEVQYFDVQMDSRTPERIVVKTRNTRALEISLLRLPLGASVSIDGQYFSQVSLQEQISEDRKLSLRRNIEGIWEKTSAFSSMKTARPIGPMIR